MHSPAPRWLREGPWNRNMNAHTIRRLLVTGATGFLGRHILPVLEQALACEVFGVGSRDFDLRSREQAEAMVQAFRPDTVLHLAAKVGGILANKNYPVDFFNENLLINTHTFEAAYQNGVKKFVTFIGGCAYPATAPSPIREEDMWEGLPAVEGAAYSIAKRVVLIQSAAYREQYGFHSVVLIPGNVYGEYDNFNEEYAHVIPALIRRFTEAKERGAESVACFGSGRPTRDFVYAGDVARLMPWFLTHYDSGEPVNISSGTRTSIKELAETVKAATGYRGRITWDTSKPDGHIDKIFSVTRLHALGLSCDTPLKDGIQRTTDWFQKARHEAVVRL